MDGKPLKRKAGVIAGEVFPLGGCYARPRSEGLLSSGASPAPGDRKMRDPGNEVVWRTATMEMRAFFLRVCLRYEEG